MAQPDQARRQWDKLAVAQTRPAMKGGVPFWAVIPIFFVPGILTVVTMEYFVFMPMIPVAWFVVKLLYIGNHNRPLEWFLWFYSGAFFANWDNDFDGISDDPLGADTPWDGLA